MSLKCRPARASKVGGGMSVMVALGKQRLGDCRLEASLVYRVIYCVNPQKDFVCVCVFQIFSKRKL